MTFSDAIEYTSAAEMQAAHKERRERLFPARRTPDAVKRIAPNIPPPSNAGSGPIRDLLHAARANGDAAENVQRSRWRDILTEVAEKHGLSPQDIVGRSHVRAIVRARHEAMYRMSTETPLSLPEIGIRLGDRDHTTALHGVRQHKKRMEAGNG